MIMNRIKKGSIFITIIAICIGFSVPTFAVTDKEFNEQQYKGVKVTTANFPDAQVRKAVKKIDENNDGVASVMEQKNYVSDDGFVIKVTGKTLNLKGLSKLKYIDTVMLDGTGNKHRVKVSNGQELSKTKLKEISFNSFKADKLTFANMKKLRNIGEYNGVSSINEVTIKNNPKLKYVALYKVKTLTFGKNKKLDYVYCEGVSKLDVKKLKNLKELRVEKSSLKTIDTTKNKKLKSLTIEGESFNKINLKKNKKLNFISITKTKIKSIDLSANTKIKIIYINDNQLKKLNVKKLTKLESLDCSGNKISKLDLSKNTKLYDVTCEGCALKKVNFGKKSNVAYIYFNDNKLETFDLTIFPKLVNLLIKGNPLKSLDFSNNPEIDYVECTRGVEVSGFTKKMKKIQSKKRPDEDAYLAEPEEESESVTIE